MAEEISVLISEEKLDQRISEMGEQISRDYEGQDIHLICILKGGTFFMCELAKRITIPVSIDFMSVSSYGNSTKSSGVVKITKDLDKPLDGKNVLVVEDIIDTGRTLSYLLKVLEQRNPASLKLATMLDKPDRRVVDDVNVDYTGFEIPDEFVVGYGLDYAEKYRNLPYIGVLHISEQPGNYFGGKQWKTKQGGWVFTSSSLSWPYFSSLYGRETLHRRSITYHIPSSRSIFRETTSQLSA